MKGEGEELELKDYPMKLELTSSLEEMDRVLTRLRQHLVEVRALCIALLDLTEELRLPKKT